MTLLQKIVEPFVRHIEFRMDLVLLQLGHRTWMDTALGSTGQHVE